MFKTIKNILCVIGIGFLLKTGYDAYQNVNKQPEPTKLETVQKVAKKASNKVMNTVSEGFTQLGKITKHAQFKTTGTQTEPEPEQTQKVAPPITTNPVQETLHILHQKTSGLMLYMQQADVINQHIHNQLTGRLKEVEAQIEHLEKYAPNQINQGPISEKNLQRKVFLLTQKMELLFTDIINEINGESYQGYSSETVEAGIDHLTDLLSCIIH